jgi:phosphoribosyl 1,2-cyclic phosphodiesterase
MELKILGAHNCISTRTQCLSLLVDGRLALDAGNLAGGLEFSEQYRLEALLLTHQHYDHVRDIPALGMNLYLSQQSLDIYAPAEAREVIIRHLLDGEMYPDFLRLPEAAPTFRFHALTPLREVSIAGYRVLPVPVPHSVPTVGYQVITPDGSCMFYTGDTGAGLGECWQQIAPDLLVIEITASDRFWRDGLERKHLTPSILKSELVEFRRLKGYLPLVIAVHMSPAVEDEIARETAVVARDLGADIRLAEEGMTLTVTPVRRGS